MFYKIGCYFYISVIALMVLLLSSPLYFGFQINRFSQFIFNNKVIQSFLFSLSNASLTLVIATIWGVLLAVILEHYFYKLKLIIYILSASLMVLPTVIVISSWQKFLGLFNSTLLFLGLGPVDVIGFFYSSWGIVLVYIFYNMPLVTIITGASLLHISVNDFYLAKNLRFKFIQYFQVLYLPNIKKILSKIIFLIFLFCFQDFSISYILGGSPDKTSLPVLIYQRLVYDDQISQAIDLSWLQILPNIIGIFILTFSRKQKFGDLVAQESSFIRKENSTNIIFIILSNILVFGSIFFLTAPFLSSLLSIFEYIKQGNILDLVASLIGQDAIKDSIYISLKIAFASGLYASFIAYLHLIFLRKFNFLVLHFLPWLWFVFPQTVLSLGLFLFLKNNQMLFIANYWPILAILNALVYYPILVYFWQEPFLNLRKSYHLLTISLRLSFWQKLYFLDWLVLNKSFYLGFCIVTALALGDLTLISFLGSRFETITTIYSNLIQNYRFESANLLQLCFILIIGVVFLPNLFWLTNFKKRLDAKN